MQASWIGAAGLAAGGFVLTALLWSTIPQGRLLTWCVTLCVTSVCMFVTDTSPRLRKRVTGRGIALPTLAASSIGGILYGLVFWLDAAVREQPIPRLSAIVVVLCISSGATGGLAGIAGHGRYVFFPMWILTVAALLAAGQWPLAAGALMFVLIVNRDLKVTSTLLVEIIRLRVHSQRQAEDALRAARHDPLTGLLNRFGLETAVSKDLATEAGLFAALFIDLDHFKLVNDRFGHATGDRLLVDVAQRLLSTAGSDSIVSRIGGDEFLVIVRTNQFAAEGPTTDPEQLAAQLIADIEVPYNLDGVETRISASVGIAETSPDLFDLGSIQQQADHALYLAKQGGRRCAVQFDAGTSTELNLRSATETDLRRAIDTGEIEAWGQPIFRSCRSPVTTNLSVEKEIVAVELLARWMRTDGSYCQPAEFIPLAEEIGLISDLGQHILTIAAETLAEWRTHPVLSTAAVAVNISARELTTSHFMTATRQLVSRWNIQPHQLILELTESANLYDIPNVDAILGDVVELGIDLAIDDFGSGYSSIRRLLQLPIQYLKLDGSIVHSLANPDDQSVLLSSIREIAETLGHTVIAEGVETEEQAHLLARHGLRHFQGYFYCRPQPLADLAASLR